MRRSPFVNNFTNTFTCIFLNCNNVFEVGARRGPRSTGLLDQKVENLAETLRKADELETPDIIGLCEIASHSLATRIAEAVSPNTYQIIWSGLPVAREGSDGGLVILYKRDTVTTSGLELDNSNRLQRPKWMAALFQLRAGSRGGFWFVVNHWKSQMTGEERTEPSRMLTAQQIGEFYLDQGRITTDSMILIGDFNCQPGDRPLRQQSPNKMKAVRERALVVRDKNRLAYFYNPLWRWLGEPDDFDSTFSTGYAQSRPIGTHLPKGHRYGWYIWDQVLVSKSLMVGSLIHFREETVKVHIPEASCSDHCAVSVKFEF